MTLDEAIKHCEEVAERNDKSAEKYDILARHTGFIYSKLTAEENKKNCEQCAADHRQLAEWLTELKECREADVQPVKRGKWLQHGKADDYFWCCSACKKWIIYAEHDLYKHHYCGNCGADMRGEDNG